MTAHDRPPAVFTIAAGLPFVDLLAAGIRQRCGDDPHVLARATILLPTRRACRALHEAFLRQSAGRALLLPRLRPLGDLDEDELSLMRPLDETLPIGDGFSVPAAISATRRRLLLARLILARPDQTMAPDQASWLAAELAKLLDQAHTERLGFEALAALVPDDFAEHWQITLTFLEILTEHWPKVLAEEGCIDPADRRNRLLDAQADLWRARPPDHPVIAAGSTGSIPATAELLGVVARLPQGMIVLPGFDTSLDAEILKVLEPAHPQYGMAQLLNRIGAVPSDVTDWPAEEVPSVSAARAALIRETMKPAPLTGARSTAEAVTAEALQGVSWITAPAPQEEAGAIALIMRETLETPGKTAALITPDRALARRVAAALKRWRIDVDDSAGRPLAQTPPGAFLRLCIRMIADDLAPVSLLAALKHPLASGGRASAAFRESVRRLERLVLRGPRPAPGIEGLRAALAATKDDAGDILDDLERLYADFTAALAQSNASLRDLVRRHVAFAEALAASDREPGATRLWAGDAGDAAAGVVAELLDAADALGPIDGRDYPALFDSLIAGQAVRPRHSAPSRLFIWGLLEARLQRADVTILGGLNEGTWPPEAAASPWMSRPMLKDFGLPAPERRIGLTAHDFVQSFCAPRVVLSRAERVDGTPTMPARWLLRLQNLIEAAGLKAAVTHPGPWLDWHEALDTPEQVRSIAAPKPKPPLEARPRQLSVSRIETWIRDPYAIHARFILGLKPLDPIDADPGAMDRGILIHGALDAFTRAYPDTLPDDALERLIAIGKDMFAPYAAWPGVRAFWWPRFERMAYWFVDFQRTRLASGYRTLASEVEGEYAFEAPGGTFTLIGRADRIDERPDNALAILDYKTGQAPTPEQVKSGLVPQLPLEAIMIEAGGFADIRAARVSELTYVRLTGGRVPGEVRNIGKDVREIIDGTAAGLKKLVHKFDDPDTPYLSRPRPMLWHRFGDYDHLARVKEWSSGEGDDT
ncbi:MAG: double-strand break repair protein AddB [Rhodospirillales bacterium]